jgi:hypothetical protein
MPVIPNENVVNAGQIMVSSLANVPEKFVIEALLHDKMFHIIHLTFRLGYTIDGSRTGLAFQGCVDEPLLALASSSFSPTENSPLGFVHIVDDDSALPVPLEEVNSVQGTAVREKANKSHSNHEDSSSLDEENKNDDSDEEFEFGDESD